MHTCTLSAYAGARLRTYRWKPLPVMGYQCSLHRHAMPRRLLKCLLPMLFHSCAKPYRRLTGYAEGNGMRVPTLLTWNLKATSLRAGRLALLDLVPSVN